jgi:antitoxin component YwqK of YwqJK toxin-antitoxin module
MRLLTILCFVLLSVHSYSQDVVTGPFLIRDGITYDQKTNEPVTGIVEKFHENGQLVEI